MKHQSMINALANHGLNPFIDANNPQRFLVKAGQAMGYWYRDEKGKVYGISTEDGREHATFPAFLNHLTNLREYH